MHDCGWFFGIMQAILKDFSILLLHLNMQPACHIKTLIHAVMGSLALVHTSTDISCQSTSITEVKHR